MSEEYKRKSDASDTDASKKSKKTLTTLKVVGVPEHFNAPWHLARQAGAFEDAGLNVEWEVEAGGTGAMCRALNTGTADVAVLLTEGVYANIAKGGKSRIVSVYVDSPLCWGIHVSAGKHAADLNDPHDLKGKRYAVSRIGSGSHLMAFVDGQQRGWDPANGKDLRFEIVGNLDGARAALKNDDADVFMWEKFTTKPIVDAGEFRRIGECLTPWPCFVVAVRNEVLSKTPEAVLRMLEVIKDSCQAFKKNESNKSVQYVAEHHKLKLQDAEEWFNGSNAVSWSCEPSISVEMLEGVGDALCKVGILTPEQKPKVEDVVWSKTKLL